MWGFCLLLFFLLPACLPNQPLPNPEVSGPSLAHALRLPTLEHLQTETWPEGSGRYAGLLKKVRFTLPHSAGAAEQLRNQVREYLQAFLLDHRHPEADCVAVFVKTNDSGWLVEAEIVCR